MGQSVAKAVGKTLVRRWVWKVILGFVGAKVIAIGVLLVVAVLLVVGVMMTVVNEVLPSSPPALMPGEAPPAGVATTSVGAPDPARLGQSYAYTAAAAIDYDGDPQAYAPPESGLATSDYLANAGHPGNWWGIETDNGQRTGNPKIGPGGYYISQTSLRLGGKSLNAQSVPFVALPKGFAGARLGDYVLLVNNSNGQKAWAIFGDVSPRQNLVEMSPAAARLINVGFKKGGTTSNAGSVTATVYPGSANLAALGSGN